MVKKNRFNHLLTVTGATAAAMLGPNAVSATANTHKVPTGGAAYLKPVAKAQARIEAGKAPFIFNGTVDIVRTERSDISPKAEGKDRHKEDVINYPVVVPLAKDAPREPTLTAVREGEYGLGWLQPGRLGAVLRVTVYDPNTMKLLPDHSHAGTGGSPDQPLFERDTLELPTTLDDHTYALDAHGLLRMTTPLDPEHQAAQPLIVADRHEV